MKQESLTVDRSSSSAADADRIWRQPASPFDKQLLIATVAWMRKLPRAVLPLATAQRFPRILNRLARSWNAPTLLEESFKHLLHDERGGRAGFPPAIYNELLKLHDYHCWLVKKRAAQRALARAEEAAEKARKDPQRGTAGGKG